jgi:phosphonate transport system substrate-binding protein
MGATSRIKQSVLAAGLFVVAAQILADTSYSFGIGPQQSAVELAKRWTPFMEYLSAKSGVTLQFTTAKDIPSFQQQMQQSRFDFALINPYHYTVFHQKSGYNAFAREKDGLLTGIIVGKADGTVKDIGQLNGQTVAFPAPNAIAAAWLPLSHLSANHISVTPQYVNSMDSVYRAVAKGIFPAGGGEMRTFGLIDPEIKKQLEVLWTSSPLPPFAFTAQERVPMEIVMKVQAALLTMHDDAKGAAILHAINYKAIEATTDADYDVVRKMRLQPVK